MLLKSNIKIRITKKIKYVEKKNEVLLCSAKHESLKTTLQRHI